MTRLSDQTLYEILEVSAEASPEEIERAYERSRDLYGPGSLATYSLVSQDEALLLQRRIEEAKAVLLDPDARGRYDERIGVRPPRSAPPPAPPIHGVGTPWPPAAPVTPPPPAASPGEPEPAAAPAAPVEPPASGAPEWPALLVPLAAAPPAAAPPVEPEAAPMVAEAEVAAPPPEPVQLPIQLGIPLASPAEAAIEPAALVIPASPGAAPLTPSPSAVGAAPAGPPAPIQLKQELPAPRDLLVPEGSAWTGAMLRQLREARGLTLPQISERTKITRHHLENIEGDRFQALPAPVYLRGILMSLARELRLDQQKVARSYLERQAVALAAAPKK